MEKLRDSKSQETNKWLYLDYQGFTKETSIKYDFVTSQNWKVVIKEREISGV